MNRISFQAKLFLHCILIISIVLAIAMILFFVQILPEMDDSIHAGIEQQASIAKKSIETLFDTNLKNVNAISDNPVIKGDFSNNEKQEMLNLMEPIYAIYDEISLVDTNGNIIVSTSRNPKGGWSNDKFFLKSLGGKVAVSDVQKENDNTLALWTFSPVFDERKNIVSVIAAEIPMSVFWKTTDSIKIGASGFVFAIDDSGKVVAHPEKALILKNPPYNFNFKNMMPSGVSEFDGMVAGYSKSLGNSEYQAQWTIFAVQPKEEFLLSLNNIISSFIILVLISFVIASFAGFVLSKRIAKPISDLHEGIKKILTGQLEHELSISTGDEIEDIANSFKEMFGKIKEKELLERLKSNMQSKVKELEKLNSLLIGREKEIARLKRMIKQQKEG